MESEIQRNLPILLLGSFPPQAQGIPGYCGALAQALAAHGPVRAIGFKAMYPAFLFPGVKTTMDPTSPAPHAPNLDLCHNLAWYNPLGWLWSAFSTPAQIVHIQWWSLPLFPVCLIFTLAAKLRRVPVVITVHNVLPHEPSPWFLRASRVLYRRADHLIVHSEVNRAQLLEHFHCYADRVSCVPMGIDAPIATALDKESARAQLGIPTSRPTILFFGTVRPYKGLDVLLRATAEVRKHHPGVLLVIAGKPWEPWARYQAIIDDLGLAEQVIARLDYIPESEMPIFYAAADLVVLPYRHFDAQSAVGVQVLGQGRPMIVTDCGGLPALVNHEARWIAPPDDAVALAEKIAGFLREPIGATASFAEIARQAGECMSWKASAEAQWAIYRRLVGRC
jgi:glycosyltransferase involved in cell wall biosynthesis